VTQHSYPTFGSLTRSAVADMYGAVSQFYSLVTAIIVILTICFLGPLFYYLPKVLTLAVLFYFSSSDNA
jgi:SulP family sulfate permease